jgi:biopolymer transport protein ExbD
VTKPVCITPDKIKKQSKKWRKSYTKNQIAIDTKSQVILAQRVAKGPRHDSKDAIPLIRKVKKYNPIEFSLDKAYDYEKVHEVIHEELNATSMIPRKKRS